jgi:hypothetical protein
MMTIRFPRPVRVERNLPMNLFAPLKPEIRRALDGIPALIDKTFPLPGRFRSALGGDVAELSRLLTGGRGERSLSYLGRPNMLSAYLRYFLPWNLYRLCRLLPGLDIPLAAGDAVTDLGAGPFTAVLALWLCRPDLRELPLEIRCVDRSGPALEAGKNLFAALAGENAPWNIRTVKGDIGAVTRKGKPAALVCAVNVFNEIFGGIPHSDSAGLRRGAENAARLLGVSAAAGASILVVEPGVPRSGESISMLRDIFIQEKRSPLSPCPHSGQCPFPGGVTRNGTRGAVGTNKKRWCHFAFETEDAPKELRRLSAQAGIPKERAVLSFLLAGPARASKPEKPEPGTVPVRVISDAFPLPDNQFGRYACSERGLVLLAGDQAAVVHSPSGAFMNAVFAAPEQRDPKSGALLAGACPP